MHRTIVIEADVGDQKNQAAILRLIDMYARDPLGGGQPLSSFARENLIRGLREHPTTHVFLGFIDGNPVGIAVCFKGFSTFASKPLLNIHDFAVDPGSRQWH